MAGLLAELELERPDGGFEPLMKPGYRTVRRVEGLAGARVREVVVPRVGRHGTRTSTRHREGRTITIDGLVRGEDCGRAWIEYRDLNAALLAATGADRLLRWQTACGARWQALTRFVEIDAPLDHADPTIRYQLSLHADDPRAFSQIEQVVVGTPLSAAEGGLEMPFTFPFTFNPSRGGLVRIVNDGSSPTPPLIGLHGYLQDPVVVADTGRIAVVGEIAYGDTLWLDAGQYGRERAVLLNGTANRLGMIRFEDTRWFDLPPGESTVQLLAPDFEPGAGIQVRFRSATE